MQLGKRLTSGKETEPANCVSAKEGQGCVAKYQFNRCGKFECLTGRKRDEAEVENRDRRVLVLKGLVREKLHNIKVLAWWSWMEGMG